MRLLPHGPSAGRAQEQPGRDRQSTMWVGGVSSTRSQDFSKFFRSLPNALKHSVPELCLELALALSAVGLGDTMMRTSS